MGEKLRFGVCGLGFMGRTHFARLQKNPNAAVVAVCDRDERRRAGDWAVQIGNLDTGPGQGGRAPLEGIRAFATAEELIRDSEVDAIVVALPTVVHAQIAVAALEAGKHVLCEKPMAYRPSECDRMIRASKASGRTLMVAQCIRFWPQYELIKQYVDEGRIGAVRFVTLRRLGHTPTYAAENWLLDGGQSGGAILDLHVHDVDFAQHLLGVPEAISACGMQGPSGGIDHVVATYNYPDGRYAVIEGGWALAAPWSFDMEIMVHGEQGTLGWALSRGHDVMHYTGGKDATPIPCEGDAYQREDDYFVDCVRAERLVERCMPNSSRTSVVLAWLERRSIETRRRVGVSERLRLVWAG